MNYKYYLNKLKEIGAEFDRLEAFSTAGDIVPPYPYQWRATAKHIEGHDDVYEGLASTPMGALRRLYKNAKWGQLMDDKETDE